MEKGNMKKKILLKTILACAEISAGVGDGTKADQNKKGWLKSLTSWMFLGQKQLNYTLSAHLKKNDEIYPSEELLYLWR